MYICEVIECGEANTGDQFDRLYQSHDDFLRRMCTLMCGNRALADDMVQETWLRAWRSLGQLREPKAARGWLVTIMRRELARYLSRAFNADSSLEEVAVEPLQTCTVEEQVLVNQVMSELDPEQRKLLQLCLLDGCSYVEVAAEMQINPSTVGVRLHRLRHALRKYVEADPVDA